MATEVLEPGELGLSYSEWRASQRRALEILEEHESGLLALQAPTGSGKSGIALGWALSHARKDYSWEESAERGRTLILTQRNVELTQYEGLLPAGDLAAWAGSLRGKSRYHCPRLKAELEQQFWPERPEEECQSEHDYCDLSDCPWPRFEADTPCSGMKDPRKCPFYSECPYYQARERARKAPVVVTNYALGSEALAQPKIVGEFDTLVADEAHDLLDILTGLAALRLDLNGLNDALNGCKQGEFMTFWEASQLRSSDGSHSDLLEEQAAERRRSLTARIDECVGEISRLVAAARTRWGQKESAGSFLVTAVQFADRFRFLVEQLADVFPEDLTAALENAGIRGPAAGRLLRLRDALGTLYEDLAKLAVLPKAERYNYSLGSGGECYPACWIFLPVDLRVGSLGEAALWGRVKRSLAMTGTLPPGRALDYCFGVAERPRVERLPLEFPPERRPVWVWSRNLDLRYATGYVDRQLLFDAVSELLASPRLRGVKGMVLWHSYKWMNDFLDSAEPGQTVFCHRDARQMPERLRSFRDFGGPAVFMSPTAYQAIDLPDDDCRYIIVPRPFWPAVPEGSVDWQRSKRLPDYMENTAGLKMVQAAGRGYRSAGDWCEVYILDRGLGHGLMGILMNSLYDLNVQVVQDPAAVAV